MCTRDRPPELKRCLATLAACGTDAFSQVDIVVVDDSAPPSRARAPSPGQVVTWVENGEPHGLFNARLTALTVAGGDIVLFLDDDVTVAPDYLNELAAAYDRHPSAAGIGGVDQTDGPRSRLLRALHRLFLYDSGRPGALSASGFPGATRRWIAQQDDFASEYLHGSNMAFRKTALAALRPVEWLTGYSLGEDLYVSQVARSHGPLFVSPRLRVWHHRSEASKDPAADTGRAQTVNMFRLLRARDRSLVGVLGFFWTMAWFVAKDALRQRRMRLVAGYVRGALDLLRGTEREPPTVRGS